jgi:MFS family permease
MGFVFGAFGLSSALFELPAGLLGDRLGVRRVLSQIVLAWSIFTALTGAAWNVTSLWVVRLLFGAGEAGCFPQSHAHAQRLAAGAGTCFRSISDVGLHPLGWRGDAASRARRSRGLRLEMDFRGLSRLGDRLVRHFSSLVQG